MPNIIEIDMNSTSHKMNAINIIAIYTPQITSQTSGSPFFQNCDRIFRAKLSPATTALGRRYSLCPQNKFTIQTRSYHVIDFL